MTCNPVKLSLACGLSMIPAACDQKVLAENPLNDYRNTNTGRPTPTDLRSLTNCRSAPSVAFRRLLYVFTFEHGSSIFSPKRLDVA
ncbi:hypothetical protein BJG93_36925 (plasmid) [Paraburkholderia sprentiae WSM5005]|uniref:Uncharacterized protein n=1 Tax=Paraburkholderia sprentiae WSM5005 TaxID=754502 RepID=A0A8F4KIQ0_9BURK|nr:hypothetical protein [Paraburkholderia sprentiae]QXE07450.1 hypothetical protein BJG93_36925 [Paraburkholderia sprentiae WSM5005]